MPRVSGRYAMRKPILTTVVRFRRNGIGGTAFKGRAPSDRLGAVAQETGNMCRFPGSHNDVPAGEFLFHVGDDGRRIPRYDQFRVLDFVGNTALLDEQSDIIATELAGRPGGEHRQTFRIFDQQPSVLSQNEDM